MEIDTKRPRITFLSLMPAAMTVMTFRLEKTTYGRVLSESTKYVKNAVSRADDTYPAYGFSFCREYAKV